MIDIRNGSRRRLSRRPLLSFAVAATAATVVFGAAVVTGNIGGSQGGSPPGVTGAGSTHQVSVKKVLDAAADRVREEEKVAKSVVPRDDQFIYTKETVKEIDRKTGKTDVRTTENWESVNRQKRGWVNEIGGKGSWDEPLGKNESTWPPPGWEAREKLPTDPVELIRYLATGPGGGKKKPESLKKIKKTDWQMLQFSLRGLATGPVAPKGLRPAAFEALAMVPGMKATAGVKDSEGRPVVGVWLDNKFDKDKMLLFDEDSHEYIGDRDIRPVLYSKKSYEQFINLIDYAIVDKVKQRP